MFNIKQKPMQCTKSRPYWASCASQPLSARAWISKMGFVPGERVLFTAHVRVPSGGSMLGSKVQLMQHIRYRAGSEVLIVKRVISEQQWGPFSESQTWDRVPIPVPAVPPSNIPHCNNISVVYRLKV